MRHDNTIKNIDIYLLLNKKLLIFQSSNINSSFIDFTNYRRNLRYAICNKQYSAYMNNCVAIPKNIKNQWTTCG